MYSKSEDYLYKEKHKVFVVDGSKVRLDKKLEEKSYKVLNHKGAYYPSALLSYPYAMGIGI